MTTMNVSLPDSMKLWVEQQASSGRNADASDYVRHLIRCDQERTAKIAHIQALVTEGIESGVGGRSMSALKAAARSRFSRIEQALEVRRYRLSRKAEEDIIAVFMHGAAESGLQQAERYPDCWKGRCSSWRRIQRPPASGPRSRPRCACIRSSLTDMA